MSRSLDETDEILVADLLPGDILSRKDAPSTFLIIEVRKKPYYDEVTYFHCEVSLIKEEEVHSYIKKWWHWYRDGKDLTEEEVK